MPVFGDPQFPTEPPLRGDSSANGDSLPGKPHLTELEEAGWRAAAQPVPPSRPLADVQRRAGRMALARRVVGGGVAAVGVFAVGVGLAFAVNGRTTGETVVAGETLVQPAAQAAEAASSSRAAPAAAAPAQPDDVEDSPPPVTPSAVEPSEVQPSDVQSNEVQPGGTSDESDLGDRSHQRFSGLFDADGLRFEWPVGQAGFGARVLSGPDALAAAEEAEVQAHEVRSRGDIEIWINHRDNDLSSVSALIDGDKFVEVTGPSADIDGYLALLDSWFGEERFGEERFDRKWFDEPWFDRKWFDEPWFDEHGEISPDFWAEFPDLDGLRDLLDMSKFPGIAPGMADDEWPDASKFEWFFGDNGLRFLHPFGGLEADAQCLEFSDSEGQTLSVPDGCAVSD